MLAAVSLLALAVAQLSAQAPGGTIAGKLTDIHSRPLDGVTVTLRSSLTGAQARTVTGKGGAYRFTSLAPGEYALEADSPQLGTGNAKGIQVFEGHESRVQTAVVLTRVVDSAAASQEQIRAVAAIKSGEAEERVPPMPLEIVPPPKSPVSYLQQISRPNSEMPAPSDVSLRGTLAMEVTSTLSMPDRLRTSSESHSLAAMPSTAGDSISILNSGQTVESAGNGPAVALIVQPAVAPGKPELVTSLAMSGVPAIRPGMIATLVAVSAAQIALAAPLQIVPIIEAGGSASVDVALTSEQMEQLPLPGRHWESFVLDSPVRQTGDSEEAEQGPSGAAREKASATVDGSSTALAYGEQDGSGTGAASLAGPAASEASIKEFRVTDLEDGGGGATTGERVHLETRSGTDKMHGQAFLFDRQNLWGARNPFTQWVKESSPGTSLTTPGFTGSPYTPGNVENRWGAGFGDTLRWHRVSWYAAIDADERNHPAVSSVKHPDHFFAQPSNDEMQVLSARLGLSSANPVAEGVQAYSKMLESLAGLLGPAPRTSQHLSGFGRLDWKAGERHRFAVEGSGALWDSPGGGLTRASETYGNHSFGSQHGTTNWALARWEAFLTPNLMAVTQGSMQRVIVSAAAETPSPFEQAFRSSYWGQLPQITVDSRYGFTIGNPARFGPGNSPDEHVYEGQETLTWVHGPLLMKAGFDLRHSADSTTLLRNHTGTYSYSTVEDFISDALVFAKYGLTDALDPMQQHNCDQRGKAWRDTTGQLHGLGYLPCYSYYKQTLGPTNWYLSTNDWAGFATAQWQPAKQLVATASLRWDREDLPPPIALVDNPALPQTQHLPKLGNTWSPRMSLAWGKSESRWPMLRAGYGMYGGRTNNRVLETALTQTGSLKGDLNFFMRPTDNLQGNSGGAPPFPYSLSGAPSSVEKPGAVEFAPNFRNAQIHQGVVEMEARLPGHILVSVSAMVSLARLLPVTVDTNYDPATNPKTITYAVVDGTGNGPIKKPQITVPFFATWPGSGASGGRLNANYQQITEIESKANSTYEAATVRVSHNARRGLSFHGRYVYGHAMDWNPNESSQVTGTSVFDPSNFALEYGTSNLDVRHSASAMAIWQAPRNGKSAEGWLTNGWILSATAQFRSGLPYSMRTAGSITREFEKNGALTVGLGPGMNGFGGADRVYGVGRNTFRYPQTWKADARLGRRFGLGHGREMELLAESFNLFNHQNVTELETTGYSIQPGTVSGSLPTLNFLTGLKSGQTEFGQPLNINAVDFYRERQFDLGLRMRF